MFVCGWLPPVGEIASAAMFPLEPVLLVTYAAVLPAASVDQ
jgi:hypothetical protein